MQSLRKQPNASAGRTHAVDRAKVHYLGLGSVVAAEHYGIALATLMMLSRFEAHERLGLGQPGCPRQEVELNRRIRVVLEHFETRVVVSVAAGSRSITMT